MPKKVNPHYAIDMSNIEHLVCHVGNLWRRLLNNKIKSLGLSGMEMRTLLCISRNPGLTQIQIANILDVEPQNLLRSLDKLERVNWIRKEADANDRRIKCLYVTPQSKSIITKIQSVSDGIKPRVLSGVDEKNMPLMIEQLTTMRENLIEQLDAEED